MLRELSCSNGPLDDQFRTEQQLYSAWIYCVNAQKSRGTVRISQGFSSTKRSEESQKSLHKKQKMKVESSRNCKGSQSAD